MYVKIWCKSKSLGDASSNLERYLFFVLRARSSSAHFVLHLKDGSSSSGEYKASSVIADHLHDDHHIQFRNQNTKAVPARNRMLHHINRSTHASYIRLEGRQYQPSLIDDTILIAITKWKMEELITQNQ